MSRFNGWTRLSQRAPVPSANQWFALRVLCASRVVVALLLLAPIAIGQFNGMFEGSTERQWFLAVAGVYLVLAALFLVSVNVLRRHFHWQLLMLGTADVVALTSLSHFAGSLHNGLSVLVVAAVAAAAVLATPTMAGFFAALATLLLLVESLLSLLGGVNVGFSSVLQSAMVGAACFVTAYVINWLASRLDRQERLAHQRGEDLRNQLAITQLVIAELQQGVLVVSPAGVLLTINRAASLLLGGRALIGEHLLRAARGAAAPAADVADQLGVALQLWQRAPAPKPESQEIVLRAPGQSSDGLRVRVRFLRARVESGDTVMVLENLRNIEERAQQLKLASMGRLSASIAHEIRNPLAAIRHANSLLAEQLDDYRDEQRDEQRDERRHEQLDAQRDEHPGAGGGHRQAVVSGGLRGEGRGGRHEVGDLRASGLAPLRRMAGIIETNTVRINRIVEDVLSISRREPPAIEAIDLPSFLPAFIGEYTGSLTEAGARERITLVLNDPAPMAFDPNHLRQILVNVLGNAWRYASTQAGAIRIEWRRQPDDRLELSVADDGPGLAPEVMQHLFEPFFTTEARGTGLGLYLARELCFANGAGIRCQRRAGDPRYPGEFVIEPRPRAWPPERQRVSLTDVDLGDSTGDGLAEGVSTGDVVPALSIRS